MSSAHGRFQHSIEQGSAPSIEEMIAEAETAIIVVGGPGAGKSATLRAAADRALDTGTAVTRVEAGGAGLGDGLRAVLEDDRTEPLLVLIDDLHAASPDELLLARRLCAKARLQSRAVIATLRPWPDAAARESAAMAQRGEASFVHLRPLDDDEALRVLADGMGAGPSTPVGQAALRLCAGNPRLLATVADALSSEPSAGYSEDDIVALVSRSTICIADTLGLGRNVRACAKAASVFGLRFRPAVALEVADLDEVDGHQAIDGLCRLGIFRQGPGRSLEFVHPLLQRVLYEQLSPAARSRLHAHAYAALAGLGFERRAAEHAILADLPGDDAAIGLLARVGRAELRDGAAAEAARKFRAAIDLASDHATSALRLALAEALIRGGQPLGAVRVLERLVSETSTDSTGRVAALHLLADSLALSGDVKTALLHLQLAAELARAVDPASAAGALLHAAILDIELGDLDSAKSLVDRARLYDTPSHSLVNEEAMFVEALVDAARGAPEATATVEDHGLELIYRLLSDTTSYGRLAAMASLTAAVVTWAGRVDASSFFIPATIRALRPHLGAGSVSGLIARRADALLEAGAVPEAAEVAAVAVDAASAAPGLRPLALAVQARALFHQGRLEESAGVCMELELADASSTGAGVFGVSARCTRAALAMVEGRTADAASAFIRLNDRAKQGGIFLPGLGDWHVFGLAALVRSGSIAPARSILSRVETAESATTPHMQVVACTGHALVQEMAGDHDGAARWFEQAMSLAGELPRLLLRIQVSWLYTGFLRRRGKDLRARRMGAQGLDLARTAGAVTLGQLIDAELTAAPSRRGRTGARPGELTAREASVVELARIGRSNKEIAGQLWISVNTVETHLQRAFAKLGVTTRAELPPQTSQDEMAG